MARRVRLARVPRTLAPLVSLRSCSHRSFSVSTLLHYVSRCRRLATSGLLLGCLSMPMALLALAQHHRGDGALSSTSAYSSIDHLIWLSVCCSILSAVNAHFGSGKASEEAGPGRCELLTTAGLALVAFLAFDGKRTYEMWRTRTSKCEHSSACK
jgi:hypothetical protein